MSLPAGPVPSRSSLRGSETTPEPVRIEGRPPAGQALPIISPFRTRALSERRVGTGPPGHVKPRSTPPRVLAPVGRPISNSLGLLGYEPMCEARRVASAGPEYLAKAHRNLSSYGPCAVLGLPSDSPVGPGSHRSQLDPESALGRSALGPADLREDLQPRSPRCGSKDRARTDQGPSGLATPRVAPRGEKDRRESRSGLADRKGPACAGVASVR